MQLTARLTCWLLGGAVHPSKSVWVVPCIDHSMSSKQPTQCDKQCSEHMCTCCQSYSRQWKRQIYLCVRTCVDNKNREKMAEADQKIMKQFIKDSINFFWGWWSRCNGNGRKNQQIQDQERALLQLRPPGKWVSNARLPRPRRGTICLEVNYIGTQKGHHVRHVHGYVHALYGGKTYSTYTSKKC